MTRKVIVFNTVVNKLRKMQRVIRFPTFAAFYADLNRDNTETEAIADLIVTAYLEQ